MASLELSKEEKLDAANKAREEVKDLLSAAKEGSVAGVNRFVKDYVTKHSKSHEPLTEADILGSIRDGNGRTALHFAATGGGIGVIGAILEMAPGVIDFKDDHGLTPLALALITGHHKAAAKLVALGADANSGDKEGVAPAHRAAGHGDMDALELLVVKGGADLETQSGAGTPLHWAAGEAKAETVQKLLSLGAAPDPRNKQGLTPLIMAAARGGGSAVVHLVQAGADAGLVLSGGATVLHICADMGLRKAVEAILATEIGRKCAATQDAQGRLPAHLAAMSSRRDIVELLLPHSGLGSNVGMEEVMARGEELSEQHEGELKAQAALQKPAPARAQGLGEEGNTRPAETAEDREAAVAAKIRGNELLTSKDLDGALAAYTEAIALDGSDAAFRSNRSAVYMSKGEFEKALVDAEVCRRLKPDWPKACYRMAVARLAMGRYEDAALAAWEGVQLDNDNQQLKSLLQKCVEKGRTELHGAGV